MSKHAVSALIAVATISCGHSRPASDPSAPLAAIDTSAPPARTAVSLEKKKVSDSVLPRTDPVAHAELEARPGSVVAGNASIVDIKGETRLRIEITADEPGAYPVALREENCRAVAEKVFAPASRRKPATPTKGRVGIVKVGTNGVGLAEIKLSGAAMRDGSISSLDRWTVIIYENGAKPSSVTTNAVATAQRKVAACGAIHVSDGST